MALARDSHLEVVPLLDEDAASFEISHSIERFDNGVVAAELDAPADNEVRILTFSGISSKEEIYPSSSETMLRRILDYYNGGGQLRVYRMYPSVTSIWSQTDYFGYSDIVSTSPENARYAFNNPGMQVHDFKLEGYEV